MFGAIAGALGGGLVNGLMDKVMGGGQGGGGIFGGLADIAGKLFDPLNLFSQNEQQAGMPDEMKEMVSMMKEMMQELMSLVKELKDAGGAAEESDNAATGQPTYINGGEGDDVINIGTPAAES